MAAVATVSNQSFNVVDHAGLVRTNIFLAYLACKNGDKRYAMACLTLGMRYLEEVNAFEVSEEVKMQFQNRETQSQLSYVLDELELPNDILLGES